MLTEVIIRLGGHFFFVRARCDDEWNKHLLFFWLGFQHNRTSAQWFCWTFAAIYSFMIFFFNLLHLNRSQFSGASETKKHDIFGQDTTFGQGKVHKRAR